MFLFNDFNFKSMNIPCFEFDKKINNEFFRKYFVVDIRKLSDDEIKNIFCDFQEFNSQLLENEFLRSKEYRNNMIVLFLYDEDRKYNINISSILYDMSYALKSFVTEDELVDIASKSSIDYQCDDKIYTSKDGNSFIQGFNLLSGLNGSGKTYLLNQVSNRLNVPIFNMDDYQLDLTDFITDVSSIDYYLSKLNELNRYGEGSNIIDYFHRLSQILTWCKEQNNPVLLDNLCWGILDDRNKINILDTLFDYSCDNSSTVVVTSCQNDIKSLVKNRIYRPNIIEVSQKK